MRFHCVRHHAVLLWAAATVQAPLYAFHLCLCTVRQLRLLAHYATAQNRPHYMPVAGVFDCTPLCGGAAYLALSMLGQKRTLPLAVVLQWGLLVHTIACTHRGFAYILMPCFLWLL